MSELTLRWKDVEHRFEFFDRLGEIVSKLTIVKSRKTQEIEDIRVPQGISMSMIEEAWIAQEGEWQNLLVLPVPIFFALRVIWLPNGWAVLWYVFHHDGIPRDACLFHKMTRQDWSFSQVIELVAKQL